MIKSKNHIIMCQSLQHINTNTKVGLTWSQNVVHVMSDRVRGNPNEFKF
jgi:hypothetical protein